MDDAIDLRPYILAVVEKWYWVLAATIGTAVIAILLPFLIPPTYEAVALVSVTEPNELVQFEAGFDVVEEIVARPLRAYPELAVSSELLSSVLSQLPVGDDPPLTLVDLSRMVIAESGSDPSLIRLKVRYRDPQVAADIANAWAGLFVMRVNQVYGPTSGEQLAAFESQLAQVSANLTRAEDELVAFQAQNRLNLVTNELNALQESQRSLFSEQNKIRDLLRDVDSLQLALNQQEGDAFNLTDELTLLLLQIRAFDGENKTQDSPINLQIDANPSESRRIEPDEATRFLDSLKEMLELRMVMLDDELTNLEPDILAWQQQQEFFATEQYRLSRSRDGLRETYLVLSQRVAEEQIASQDTANESVRLASQAALPEVSVGPRRLVILTLGSAVGAIVSILGLLLTVWWRSQSLLDAAPSGR